MQTKTRLTALLLGLVLIFCLSACQKAPAETADAPAQTADFGIFPEIAGENGTAYANLFDVILNADYDNVWTEKCAAIVGEDGAAEAASYLKSYISRDIYGQEAVDAYTSAELVGFDCWYINVYLPMTFYVLFYRIQAENSNPYLGTPAYGKVDISNFIYEIDDCLPEVDKQMQKRASAVNDQMRINW